ncbi:MAG: hypothetical protein FWF44_06875 [Defluviitaleaceae bacterium]|nr:hypothetical protein [Defluviitaleaceae bacterium]
MSNEDKIMDTLETLVYAVNGLAGKVDMLGTRFDKLEARVEDIHCNVAKMEIENDQAYGAIFDKLDILDKKTDQNTAAILRIEERLDTDEVYIRIFDSKLRKVE